MDCTGARRPLGKVAITTTASRFESPMARTTCKVTGGFSGKGALVCIMRQEVVKGCTYYVAQTCNYK